MTPEEMRAGVERLAPWFHRIELAPGVYTKDSSIAGEPVDHPMPTWTLVRQALPDDLSGKTVLDIGCNGGFYAVEAKRRGAARVLGVDSQRREVAQARFVRRALDLDIEFERMSVYDIRPSRARSPRMRRSVLSMRRLCHDWRCDHGLIATF